MAIQYGETIGYRITDLTYAGDLIANVGESITSVLDKIINMLGDFEYFYDLDGRFVFQKKPTFIYTSWNNITRIEDEEFVDNAAFSSACTHHFENNNLIASFSNSPDLANVRNDFSIWGTRKGISGDEIPVHLRYAIDRKPDYYKNFDGQVFVSNQELFDKLKNEKRQEIEKEFQTSLDSFTPSHTEGNISLQQPTKNEDGSWTPGWWDIRDWAKYYAVLTSGKKEEDITERDYPKGTMKWYSHNSEQGCVPVNTLPGYEYDVTGKSVWLIIVSADGKNINTQHGLGFPESTGRESTYHESQYEYDANGNIVTDAQGYKKYTTQKIEGVEKKYFIPPFSVCTDSHTYLEFLEKDMNRNGNRVYFYNPNFPNMTFDDTVDKTIQDNLNEMIENRYLNLVDWREIIYQMALDYYKYAHNTNPEKGLLEDEFLSKIRLNNIDYYPKGYTGYEQYYQDLQGFWRQLYNPWPEYETEIQSAEGLATEDTPPDKVLVENAFRPFEKYMIDASHTTLDLSEELYYRLVDYNSDFESAGLIYKEESTTGIAYKIKDDDIRQSLIADEIPGKDYNTSYYAYYIYQNDSNGKNLALWYDTLKIKTAYQNAKNFNEAHVEKALYYMD